jgi:ribosomal protein S18 acetylase RimI-like enzyme
MIVKKVWSPMPQPRTPIQLIDVAPEDANRLLPLLDTLGYPSTEPVLRGRLQSMFDQDRSTRVIGVESGGHIVGFACLHETPVPHRPTSVGRITAIAVLPGTRGSGAGRALVEAAEAHFKARGIARLEVTSGDNHKAAHPFYRHLGYTAQGIRFAKELT